jgi:hypothetical protein
MIRGFPTSAKLRRYIQTEFEKAKGELIIKELDPEPKRALQRLALVMVAGRLAVELDILRLDFEEIGNAIFSIRDACLVEQ